MASTIPVETVNGHVTEPEEKTYTIEHLKEHGKRESLWMLLHDKVYDVTKFIDEVGCRTIASTLANCFLALIAIKKVQCS